MTRGEGDVEIRPARGEDATAIAECVTAAYEIYTERLGNPARATLDDYTKVIQQHRVFVLCETEKIIGILVRIIQNQSFFVDNVAEHPDQRGRGYGRKLMALAKEEARRFGV